MTARVVAYGEVLWDHLPAGRRLGGAPLNLVHRLNGLGHKGLMISRLGRDDAGREARRVLQAMGVDDRCVQWDPAHPTGAVLVGFDARGVPDISIQPETAYDYIEPTPDALAAARSADCLCFGTLAQRSSVSRATLARLLETFGGRYRFADLNLRKDCWSAETVLATLDAANVLKISEEEALVVADLGGWTGTTVDGIASRLVRTGTVTHVAITLGPGGALAITRGGRAVYAPAFRVPVVDTLGCGDAFSAGFLHGLLCGWDLRRALRYGNAAGAAVAQQCGATEPLDTAAVDNMRDRGQAAPSDPRFTDLLSPSH